MAVESVATAALTPAPGFVERDMEDMWRDNCAVIRGVLKKSGVRAEEIAGVGLCGHGKGLYLWGKDGKSARRGILSADNRAWKYPVEWRKDGTEERAFALSCQHVMACQPVSLLAWLRDNEPETMKNVRWVFECKDYVRFRLTGEARAEITDYSGSGLMDLHTKSFSKELLSLFGIEGVWDALPPLCASLDIAGHITPEAAALTGLLPGTPVIGGMFDIDACALAVNVTDETNICMIAGTWSINEYPRRAPITDGSVLMNSLFCLPGYYLIEESSPHLRGQQPVVHRPAPARAQGRGEDGGKEHLRYSERLGRFVCARRFCAGVPAVSDGEQRRSARPRSVRRAERLALAAGDGPRGVRGHHILAPVSSRPPDALAARPERDDPSRRRRGAFKGVDADVRGRDEYAR